MSKSAVVRGASKAASIWNKIDTAVKAKGGSEDALDILDRKEGAPLVDVIADILVKAELKTRTCFTVEVDYTKPVADMVAAGEYGYANPNITAENFPIEGDSTVETEVVLVHFDRSIKSEAAITELEQMGLEPCKIEHLLALGAKHPDLQREFPIICLGSSRVRSVGSRYVPYLDHWLGRRELFLHWFGSEWGGHCRFAAVASRNLDTFVPSALVVPLIPWPVAAFAKTFIFARAVFLCTNLAYTTNRRVDDTVRGYGFGRSKSGISVSAGMELSYGSPSVRRLFPHIRNLVQRSRRVLILSNEVQPQESSRGSGIEAPVHMAGDRFFVGHASWWSQLNLG